jgi:hypothetical protein
MCLLLSLSVDVRSSDDVITFEGPWAETQRGKMHDGFNSTNMFVLYTLNYGQAPAPGTYHDPALYYRMWAHKVNPTHPLYIGDVKIDTLFTPAHKRALLDYYATRGYGARFPTEIYTRGCHWFPRLLA